MADVRYFNGDQQLNGLTSMPNATFKDLFPGVRGIPYDGYTKKVAYPLTGPRRLLPVERCITYKSQPSRHECNAKCMNGKHNGTCECRCGGKNHGLSMFSALLKAA